jgi:PAS domain S-box-containing protein
VRWLQLALQPRIADRWVICEGFILDINERKKIEIELAEYRINLEHLVKERTEELDTAIEELRATNEQMESKNNELYREMEACTNAVKLLEESEAKMRNFIDQSLEGILIFDNNGCVIEWNPSMEDITGLKKENAIGKLEWELRLKMYPEDQRTQQELDNLRKKRLAYMNDENSQKTVEDVSFHFADGSVTYARVSLFPIKVSDTKRYFGRIVRDISRQYLADMELSRYRSNLEEMVRAKTKELTIAKEKAEESDRLKSAFLANMSHEVRTPLNGIVGLLNILAADPEVPENIREYIDIINKNSEILQRLINDILDAAKLESGLMAIIPEPVYIDNLIDEMFIIFQHQLQTSEKAHIELETVKDANADNCSVYADPVRLRQIIHNLLSNAVKFTDSGYIRFGYSVHKPDSIEFFVEDTGAGISATQTGHIFERFRQAEGGRRAGGTGLGLTISRNLAQLMGGDMTVESVEGKGSIFTFSIAYKPVTTN